jgi:hypothetical protein
LRQLRPMDFVMTIHVISAANIPLLHTLLIGQSLFTSQLEKPCIRGIGNLAIAIDRDASVQPPQVEMHNNTIHHFADGPQPAVKAVNGHLKFQCRPTSIRSRDIGVITSVPVSVMRI